MISKYHTVDRNHLALNTLLSSLVAATCASRSCYRQELF